MDLLVRSPSQTVAAGRERVHRLATPPVEASTLLSQARLWWVERVGGHVYLRAVGVAAPAIAAVGPERVVWNAGDGFDFLSRIGVPARSRALDVTAIVPAPVDTVTVETIADSVVSALEAAAAGAVRRVRSPRLASAELRPALRRLAPPTTFADAVAAVRQAFAADELVAPVGEEPYAFAAQLLLAPPSPSPAPFRTLTADTVTDAWPLPSAAPDEDARTPRHQEILRGLVRECERLGYEATCNAHVDARIAVGEQQILFEVKTADEASFVPQVRLAVGQLLDYRHRYGSCAQATTLCIVVDDVASRRRWARSFLADVEIEAVFVSHRLDGLAEVLSKFGREGREWA